MRDVVIIDAVRTPVGRYGGALKDVRPDDLLAHTIARLVERTHVPAACVEDVYAGCANQAGEDNRNVARMAALLAGLPVEIPGATVNRLCGSGLEAVNQAARAVQTESGEVVIAGGVESMTRAPLVARRRMPSRSRATSGPLRPRWPGASRTSWCRCRSPGGAASRPSWRRTRGRGRTPAWTSWRGCGRPSGRGAP
jgi:acetyl-CoA acetyltransferase